MIAITKQLQGQQNELVIPFEVDQNCRQSNRWYVNVITFVGRPLSDEWKEPLEYDETGNPNERTNSCERREYPDQ